jgi:hypothetical protein
VAAESRPPVTEPSATHQRNEPDKHGQREPDGHEPEASEPQRQAFSAHGRASLPWGGPGPIPRGSGPAYQAVGEVASPLLAGFSVTLIGVIAQSPASMRWPGFSLTLLTLAAAFLLAAVQCGFHARQRFWTREDLLAWYIELTPASDRAFAKEHQLDTGVWDRWVKRTRRFYNLGICTLAAAVATVVAPPHDSKDYPVSLNEEVWRWIATSLAVLCLLIEVAWWLRPESTTPRTPRTTDDTGSTDDDPIRSATAGDNIGGGTGGGTGRESGGATDIDGNQQSEDSESDD